MMSLALAAASALATAGCNYSSPMTPTGSAPSGTYTPGVGIGGNAPGAGPEGATATRECEPIPASDRQAILDSVIKLIQTAPLKPGGDNFAIATQNLNQFFCDTRPEQFQIPAETRSFLLQYMPEMAVLELEKRTFGMPDARHLEDCMLYHNVARRIGGEGEDLARVRRVFRWIVEQIELVPAGTLAVPVLGQAYARPYDVLVRGMATEGGGTWAERGWLFMVLCRQLGVDVGLLTYTPEGAKEPIVWTCAALTDGKLHLFDLRLGLEIPGPGGDGVATLDEALADPAVLARLDLPGQSGYGTSRESLILSTSKIGVLVDSSPGYRAPRMAMLQANLAGRNRTVLYSEPLGERDRLLAALGTHAGSVGFWELPARVEFLLFHDPRFIDATRQVLFLFDANHYPLISARIKQLQGETAEAIQEYVSFRYALNPVEVDKKTPIPPEVQKALDVHATYFLGLCHLEQGHPELAEPFFEKLLVQLPEFGPRQPFYTMFRWGAQANLGRIYEARGDAPRAISYYSMKDPTTQGHGDLVRARDLLWPDPMADYPPAPPPPPGSTAPPALIAAPEAAAPAPER